MEAIFRLLSIWRLDRSLTGLYIEGQIELILQLEALMRLLSLQTVFTLGSTSINIHAAVGGCFRLLSIWRLDRSLTSLRLEGQLDLSLRPFS